MGLNWQLLRKQQLSSALRYGTSTGTSTTYSTRTGRSYALRHRPPCAAAPGCALIPSSQVECSIIRYRYEYRTGWYSYEYSYCSRPVRVVPVRYVSLSYRHAKHRRCADPRVYREDIAMGYRHIAPIARHASIMSAISRSARHAHRRLRALTVRSFIVWPAES